MNRFGTRNGEAGGIRIRARSAECPTSRSSLRIKLGLLLRRP
jgi:hypothetical protein